MEQQHIVAASTISGILASGAAIFKYRKFIKSFFLFIFKKETDSNKYDDPVVKNFYIEYKEINRRVKFCKDIKIAMNSSFREDLLLIIEKCRKGKYNSLIFDFNNTVTINEYAITCVVNAVMNVINENNINLIITCSKRPNVIDLYTTLSKLVDQFDTSHVKVYLYDRSKK